LRERDGFSSCEPLSETKKSGSAGKAVSGKVRGAALAFGKSLVNRKEREICGLLQSGKRQGT